LEIGSVAPAVGDKEPAQRVAVERPPLGSAVEVPLSSRDRSPFVRFPVISQVGDDRLGKARPRKSVERFEREDFVPFGERNRLLPCRLFFAGFCCDIRSDGKANSWAGDLRQRVHQEAIPGFQNGRRKRGEWIVRSVVIIQFFILSRFLFTPSTTPDFRRTGPGNAAQRDRRGVRKPPSSEG